MDKTAGIKVIIADDHQLFRRGVMDVLKKMRFISSIKEASTGKEVLEILDDFPADLVLMDISMPQMDGEVATKLIRKKFPDMKIIALTMHADERNITEMYKAGVNGYILKNTDRDELEKAIRLIMEDKSYNSLEVAELLLPELIKKNLKLRSANTKDKLSERETEIIRLLYQELSTREIAKKLFLSTRTVENHRRTIIRKTKTKNTIGLLKYAIEHGIC